MTMSKKGDFRIMKRITRCLMVALLAAPAWLLAQTAFSPSDSSQAPGGTMVQTPAPPIAKAPRYTPPAPFSRLALEGGIGIGGINMQAAVEANRYLNIRGIGNYFSYSVNNVKVGGSGSSGANVSGKFSLAEAGIALDYYPWPNHGFRVSPGVTLYNGNGASASGVMAEGSSISLASTKYYSEAANPMNLNANLGLNTHKQTFTITTGWGNMISRRGGHWAFPFELGAIFTGAPTLGLNITGFGCTVQSDAAINGASCVNMATNAAAQADINSQIAKYQSDVNPLKVYPVLSVGVSYNFNIR
jgi:hypothetical protein